MNARDSRQSSPLERIAAGRLALEPLWTEAAYLPTRPVTLLTQDISKLGAVLWRV
jgi:hypothetical protein